MMNRGVVIGAFALVAAIAVAGWVRPSVPAVTAPADQQILPADRTGTVAAPAVYHQPARVQRVVERQYVAPRHVVKKRRSTRNSVAIVAGSAGAGAAIGALAGGGKGAAIGALSGGAAGFIYDHITAHR